MTERYGPSVHCLRSVLWEGGELELWELCELFDEPAGPALAGTVVGRLDGVPLSVRYRLRCSPDWRTREIAVEVRGPRSARIDLRVDPGGRWLRDGTELGELSGLVDVDLGITPATNTLPIRRLGLEIGESAEVTAAWVRFPGLEPSALAQRYTRLDERRYRYESGGGAFTAELEVDELGLVRRYGDYWRALDIAPSG